LDAWTITPLGIGGILAPISTSGTRDCERINRGSFKGNWAKIEEYD
jgi:hypothetical protein